MRLVNVQTCTSIISILHSGHIGGVGEEEKFEKKMNKGCCVGGE